MTFIFNQGKQTNKQTTQRAAAAHHGSAWLPAMKSLAGWADPGKNTQQSSVTSNVSKGIYLVGPVKVDCPHSNTVNEM